jgi:uncharacterized protein YjlB
MAVMQSRDNRTYTAGADLSAAQFKFVKISGANVVVASSAGEQCIGVCIVGGASGAAVTVTRGGSVMVTAGATISAGAAVSTDASGLAKAAATGNIIMGYAREAGVNGQVIEIELISGGNASA